MSLTYINGPRDTISGFILVIFPFLCQENKKLSQSILDQSILDYHNDISVTGLLLWVLSSMLCFASILPQIQLLEIVSNKYQQPLINWPIRSQIASIFIGSVNFIFLNRLIPSLLPS